MPFLILALGAASGCGRDSTASTAPTTLALQQGSSVVLTADPAALRSEAIVDPTCSAAAARGTRLAVIASGTGGASLLSLRFRFTNTAGATVFPEVIPIPGLSRTTVPVNQIPPQSPIPMLGVAPLPTTPPIQLPAPQRMPFLLSFGCGVPAGGILVVTADVSDPTGKPGTSELRLPVD